MTCSECNDTRSIMVFGADGAQMLPCEACYDTPEAVAAREQGPLCVCGCPKAPRHGGYTSPVASSVTGIVGTDVGVDVSATVEIITTPEEIPTPEGPYEMALREVNEEVRLSEWRGDAPEETAAFERERERLKSLTAARPGWTAGCTEHADCMSFREA